MLQEHSHSLNIHHPFPPDPLFYVAFYMYVRLGVMSNMVVKCLGSHLVYVSHLIVVLVYHAMKKFHTRERERERERV